MSPANRASWLTAKQSPVNVLQSAPYTSPIANELVIQTKAIALNPADVIVQKLGILIADYPAILGCDVAGEVVEIDASLANTYKIGDRVIGSANCLHIRDGRYCYSGFQEYVVLKVDSLAKIPADVAYEDAVVLPLGMNTAASCLFGNETLALNLPSTDVAERSGQGKTVLIWGASSSVGACGVQLAAQAGYEVIGIASQRNHELVKSLGASATFDYSNAAAIVDEILKHVEGKELVGALCAINSDDALNTLCEVLDGSGGKKLVSSVTPGAEAKASRGVTIVTNFGVDPSSNNFAKPVWAWINEAMAQKSIKYAPPSEVVGKGLEDVQKGVDLLGEGVSGKKLVVSLS